MRNTKSFESYKKSPYRSIKHSTYFDTYDWLLSKYRGKKITFVEIGILGGGSLFMWRDFFGDQARIIGVDLNENALKWRDYGFEIFIGDQSKKEFWEDFKKEIGHIDIILDDGGHTYEQQIVTIESLLDSITDGGLLLVEDCHTSYLSGFGPTKYSLINYVKKKIDQINFRFNELNSFNSEKRIWSIEIFESIIAFKVNRIASRLDSYPTDNHGIDDVASDARYQTVASINFFQKLSSRAVFLKKNPLARFFAKFLKSFFINIDFKAKKYFN